MLQQLSQADSSITKSRAGFTLLEVLMSSAILSIIAIGINSLVQVSVKATRNVSTYNEFNTLVSTIQLLFDNASNCPQLFSGQTYSFPAGGTQISSPVEITPLRDATGAIVVGATPSSWGNQLTIEQLAFTQVVSELVPAAGTRELLMEVKLIARKRNSQILGAIGSETLSYNFYLVLVVNTTSGAVTACSQNTDRFWSRASSSPNRYFNSQLGDVWIGTRTRVTGLPASSGSQLYVSGNTQLRQDTTAALQSQLNRTLNVQGSTQMAQTLAVSGASSLSSTLNVAGASNLLSGLTVNNTSTLNNTLSVGQSAALGDYAEVQDRSFPGTASVTIGCSQDGALAYDSVQQSLIYCRSGVWTYIHKSISNICTLADSTGTCPTGTTLRNVTVAYQAKYYTTARVELWVLTFFGGRWRDICAGRANMRINPADIVLSGGVQGIQTSGNQFNLSLCCN